MKRLQIRLQGTTPLLMNRFTDEAQISATTGTRASKSAASEPRQDAASRLYLSAEDNETVVVPQPNLLRCIIDAGKWHKMGRTKVTTQKSSIVSSCVFIPALEVPLVYTDPWSVDSRPVRIPATGGRIIRHRPRFDAWSAEFEAELDDEIMSAAFLREIIDSAGKRIGLGDFRPDCKGPFGRFVVTLWAELAAEPEQLACAAAI